MIADSMCIFAGIIICITITIVLFMPYFTIRIIALTLLAAGLLFVIVGVFLHKNISTRRELDHEITVIENEIELHQLPERVRKDNDSVYSVITLS